jgi:hypothetical protein
MVWTGGGVAGENSHGGDIKIVALHPGHRKPLLLRSLLTRNRVWQWGQE